MVRLKLLVSVVVLTCAAPVLADDKPALSGTWARSGAELTIAFPDKDTVRISPHGDDAVILIVGKPQAEQGGRVKVKVTALQGKEEATKRVQELVPVGYEFSFRWQAKDDGATLDEMKGDNMDLLKAHLEGKYERKK